LQGAAAAGSTTYTLPSADGSNGQVLATNGSGTLSWTTAGGGGSGDVVGPASATDNAITRFDQTTGKLIQNSTVILDDSGTITGVAALAAVTASITSANVGTAVITALTATGASVASANVGTGVITALTATGASVASANVGTAIITTGTVTNLTSTSASIASMNAGVALFTTGTITNLTATQASITSANARALRFIGSISGYVGFLAAATAGSAIYVLPSADGTSGQVLTTNGTGTLSWSTASGSGGGAQDYIVQSYGIV